MVCSLCHDTGDHAKPDDGCAMCHTRKDHDVSVPPKKTHADLQFTHQVHQNAGIDCLDCHKEQEQASRYKEIHFPKMNECRDCHNQRGASTDCQTCHTYWRADTVPDFHNEHWLRQHGRFARDMFESKCVFCHQEKSFCVDCHLSEPPPSHTLFFKNRGHGFVARGDRQSCQACHQQDACLECHTSVMPASHIGAFASPPYLHCVQCHLPSGDANGCSACHQAGLTAEKHREASPPAPDFIMTSGQLDCLSACHNYMTTPPPHPLGTLNNADCIRCHFDQ